MLHKFAKEKFVIARILIAALFIFAGFGKIMGFEGTVGYVGSVLPMAELITILVIIIELGGGIMLAIGYKAAWAARVLALFTVLASVIYHTPLFNADYADMQGFLKNMAVTGGLILVCLASCEKMKDKGNMPDVDKTESEG